MSCPISQACYNVVDNHYMSGSRRHLFADLAERWQELGFRVFKDDPQLTTVRVRAFFVIEVTYHIIFPGLALPAEMISMRERFLNMRFSRSRDGLTALLRLCEEANEGLTITQGEFDLSDNPNNTWKQVRVHLERPRTVTDLLAESARCLRPMLRGPTNGIAKVGRLFGEVLVAADVSLEVCERYINTTLDVSIHNPVSPWLMKTYPVSLST